jgi:hypothetical protein
MKLHHVVREMEARQMDLLWIIAMAIVATWLAVEFMRGHT